MKAKGRDGLSRWVKPLLIGTAVGVIVATVLLLGAAVFVSRVDIPRSAVFPLTVGLVAVGAFVAGWVASAVGKERGLLLGVFTGLILFLIVVLSGLLRLSGIDGLHALIKAVSLTVAGGLGGLLGVHRRRH